MGWEPALGEGQGGHNSAVSCALASEKQGRLGRRTPTPSRGGRGSLAPGQRRCWIPRLLPGSFGSAAPKGSQKIQGCMVRESTNSPTCPEAAFLPQNSSGARWDGEGEQGWAAFIANVCQGAEYLAWSELLEMPALFKRDRQRLPASCVATSGRDGSLRSLCNPPTNTQLYLISTYGVIYPVF